MDTATDWTHSQDPLWMIKQAAKQGGFDTELRLFACWCARQTDLKKDEWQEAVGIAERFAKNGTQTSVMRRLRNGVRGLNAAVDAMDETSEIDNEESAAGLVAYQTLRTDPIEAARQAARMSALWAKLSSARQRRDGTLPPPNAGREAERRAQQAQANKLREMIDLV